MDCKRIYYLVQDNYLRSYNLIPRANLAQTKIFKFKRKLPSSFVL